jgi:hypothetical protein
MEFESYLPQEFTDYIKNKRTEWKFNPFFQLIFDNS